jgi:TatD DNase family protein
MLIDSHAHLDHQDFASDLEAVLARARAAGVARIVTVGTDLESSRRCLALCETWPGYLHATAGVHPHDAAAASEEDLEALEALAREQVEIVAVGEVGLDYHYDLSPRPVQQERFARQVALAREIGKPLVIHVREAHDDAVAILRESWGAPPIHGVLHCFTGDLEQARVCVELGLHVSFSGIVSFPKAREIQQAAAWVPADRLLCETDAPYLAPVPHRGKRNEPAFVARTAEVLAGLRGETVEALVRSTGANACALFGL